MIVNITVLDRIDSNTRLKGWSVPRLTLEFQEFWRSLMGFMERAQTCRWKLCFDSGVTARREAATHSGTRWRSPRWPWPRVCPGRKGDISGSHPPLCGAGRCRATSPAPPQSTRWRGRCTYTWGRQRRWWKRAFQTHWLKFRFRRRGNVLLFSRLLSWRWAFLSHLGHINWRLTVKLICIVEYSNDRIKFDAIAPRLISPEARMLHPVCV